MMRPRQIIRNNAVLGPIILILLISLPFWLIQSQFILSVCTISLIFMTAALGWNIISGFGGQISFGHSIFFGLAAYTSAIWQSRYGGNAWVGMVFGIVVAMVVALLFGWVTLRLRGIFFALASFAITLTFLALAAHFDDFTGGHVGLTLPIYGASPANFSFENRLAYYYAAIVCAAIAFVVGWIVLRSRLGLQLRSVKADQDAAKACGVKATQVKMTGLLISAALTGLAGVMYLQYIRYIDPDSAFGANLATQIAVIAFVGGSGRLWGPVLGAALLVPLQQVLNSELSALPAGINLVIYGFVILIILLIEPRGLLALRWRTRRNRNSSGTEVGTRPPRETDPTTAESGRSEVLS